MDFHYFVTLYFPEITMRYSSVALLLVCLTSSCAAQEGKALKVKKIPVKNGVIENAVTSKTSYVKEPEVRFLTDHPEVFAVAPGTVTFATNLNVIIEADTLTYTYVDVKGSKDLEIGKKIKRGDQIGSMYYNDERQKYGFFLSIRKGKKKFMSREEIVKLTQKG